MYQDYVEALKWGTEAAEQGNSIAQNALEELRQAMLTALNKAMADLINLEEKREAKLNELKKLGKAAREN